MAKKIINEVITEATSANSSMLDGENKPKFLTRKSEEAGGGRREIDDYLSNKKKRKFIKPLAWIGGIVVAVILFFVVSNMFTSAKVVVTPRNESVTVDEKDTLAKNPGDGQLGFSVATVQDEGQALVSQNGTKRVERKAGGQIAVFNSFTDKPYKLIANTRFQRQDGKIYRIANSITIPGDKVVAGKTVPGSVQVTVTADQAGADYNGDPTDFTVPGLKGDPAFDKVFARSVTPLTGGYAGDVYVISDADKATARVTIQTELDKSLRDKLSGQTDQMIVLENSIQTQISELQEPPVTGSAPAGGKVAVTAQGTLRAVTISTADLAKFLAHSHLSDYGGEDISIKDPASLTITTATTTLPKDLGSLDTLDVSFKGSANLAWAFNADDLKAKLAGIKKSAATAIFQQFAPIQGAKVYMRPPWAQSFPKDTSKISIEIQPSNP